MPFTISDIVLGGIVPVIVSAGVLLALRQLSSPGLNDRYSASVAMLCGFLSGYALLELGPWHPDAHWHWLPYAMLSAALVGPVCCVTGVNSIERGAMYALLAVAVGSLLVPTWEDLDPTRPTYLIGFVAYVTLLTGLMDPLAKRLRGPSIPIAMWATITAVSIVLAISGSLRFAQIGISGAGAMFGIMLCACVVAEVSSLQGLSLGFAILTVGGLLIGQVNSFSDVPWISYLIIPVAPLSLWITTVGPLSQPTGVKRMVINAVLVATVLGIGVATAVVADLHQAGEY
jgi:hypothetical protein